jgi:hypothetical protein
MAPLQLLGSENQRPRFFGPCVVEAIGIENGGWLANSAIQQLSKSPLDVWNPPTRRPVVVLQSRRSTEIGWRRAHPEELRRYFGEWVALEGRRIVAHGTSLAQVVREARIEGIAIPYVFRVDDLNDATAIMGL